MSRPPLSWPPALAGTPAVTVIERAIGRDRLGHSLLLHGDDLDTLEAVARAIADRLLQGLPPDKHPDYFTLRPTGKMRQISADATRELIADMHVSAAVASRKVAVVYEADRMNATAANIFLKTLEEPPANTMLLLLTTHPYALLPTIRSRCLHFRFPLGFPSKSVGRRVPATPIGLPQDGTTADGSKGDSDPWGDWRSDYRAWHARISAGTPDKRALADHIFSIYGLVARFKAILDDATAAAWAKVKDSLPPELEEDEQVAIETGLGKGLRARFFAEIEEATRIYAVPRLEAGDALARRAFTAAIEKLEHNARLFAYNLNESAVLEDFMLASLRLWSKR